eukprot:6192540-Pleurochrysis_carterae.AAC.1
MRREGERVGKGEGERGGWREGAREAKWRQIVAEWIERARACERGGARGTDRGVQRVLRAGGDVGAEHLFRDASPRAALALEPRCCRSTAARLRACAAGGRDVAVEPVPDARAAAAQGGGRVCGGGGGGGRCGRWRRYRWWG